LFAELGKIFENINIGETQLMRPLIRIRLVLHRIDNSLYDVISLPSNLDAESALRI
jgi:hypothetical protein